MNIGDKIRKIRTEKGISQEYLGNKIGASQNVITNIESGKRSPSLEELYKISETLEEPFFKFLDLPMNVEFNNCSNCQNLSTITHIHQFPPELIAILDKLANNI